MAMSVSWSDGQIINIPETINDPEYFLYLNPTCDPSDGGVYHSSPFGHITKCSDVSICTEYFYTEMAVTPITPMSYYIANSEVCVPGAGPDYLYPYSRVHFMTADELPFTVPVALPLQIKTSN